MSLILLMAIQNIINGVARLKELSPNLQIIAGNVATPEAVTWLKLAQMPLRLELALDPFAPPGLLPNRGTSDYSHLRLFSEARKLNIPIVADGGIKYSGDIPKAIVSVLTCNGR